MNLAILREKEREMGAHALRYIFLLCWNFSFVERSGYTSDAGNLTIFIVKLKELEQIYNLLN